VLLVKGAAECILERCNRLMLPDGKVVPLKPAARTAILNTVDTMASQALRILALAKKTDLPPDLGGWTGEKGTPGAKKLLDAGTYGAIESDLVFLGLAGLQDPPRPEVPDAIEDCRRAGVRVIVITGGRGEKQGCGWDG
jgi:Ca2+-transporting ATPase